MSSRPASGLASPNCARYVRSPEQWRDGVDLRFDEHLTLGELAGIASISVFRACRAFRSVRNTSIDRCRQCIRSLSSPTLGDGARRTPSRFWPEPCKRHPFPGGPGGHRRFSRRYATGKPGIRVFSLCAPELSTTLAGTRPPGSISNRLRVPNQDPDTVGLPFRVGEGRRKRQ
jgi:hypothetical protein